MKIRMTNTAPGSIDGICVKTYSAGTEFDLTATDGERDLAAAFVGAGLAEEVGTEPDEQPVETEANAAEPERKKPGRKPKAA